MLPSAKSSTVSNGRRLSTPKWTFITEPRTLVFQARPDHRELLSRMPERLLMARQLSFRIRASKVSGRWCHRDVAAPGSWVTEGASWSDSQNSSRSDANQRRGYPGMTVRVPLSDS